MEDLRLVMFVLGTVGILAVLVHGFLSIRKQQSNTIRAKPRAPYNVTPGRRDSEGFDSDGVGEVRVKQRSAENDNSNENESSDAAERDGRNTGKNFRQPKLHKSFFRRAESSKPDPQPRSQPEHKEPVMANVRSGYDRSTNDGHEGFDSPFDSQSEFELGGSVKKARERHEPSVGRHQGNAASQVQLGLLDELPSDSQSDSHSDKRNDYFAQVDRAEPKQSAQPQYQQQQYQQQQYQQQQYQQQYQQQNQQQQYKQQQSPQPQYQEQQPSQRMPEPPRQSAPEPVKEQPLPDPRDVLVLHVVAREGRVLAGAELLPCLLELNFKFGDMDIFHRHEDNAGTGKVLFSLANMVKPGVFDPDSMEQFNTHGVVMFMTLPCHGEAMLNFSTMLKSAYQLAEDLNALVLDGQRQLWSEATQADYVARIRKNA